jgi:fluoroquinolone resistance protein
MALEINNENKTFKTLDLTEQSFMECSFTDCTFEHCAFVNSIWIKTKFHSCTFICCNISFVTVDGCFLQDVTFLECKIVGIEFHKCNKVFFCINIKNSILLNCNFSDLNMQKACCYKSSFKECFFTNTQLMESDFTGADLQGSIFHKCNLEKADLRGAKNYTINLHTNIVKKAQFSYPEVMSLLTFFDIVIDE